jgi:hypothetical protein
MLFAINKIFLEQQEQCLQIVASLHQQIFLMSDLPAKEAIMNWVNLCVVQFYESFRFGSLKKKKKKKKDEKFKRHKAFTHTNNGVNLLYTSYNYMETFLLWNVKIHVVHTKIYPQSFTKLCKMAPVTTNITI